MIDIIFSLIMILLAGCGFCINLVLYVKGGDLLCAITVTIFVWNMIVWTLALKDAIEERRNA